MNSSQALTHLVELAGNVANAYTTALYQLDHESDSLHLKTFMTLSSHFDESASFQVGQSLIGMVAQNRVPLLLEKSVDDKDKLKIYKKKESVKDFLILPVRGKDLEGVLVVDTKERYNFSTKLQKILSEFASQMAWHIEAERQEARMHLMEVFPYPEMIEYGRQLSQSKDPMEVARNLVDLPLEIVKCDATALVWFENDDQPGSVIQWQGWDRDLGRIKVFPGKGLVGSCAKNRAPILIPDTEKRNTILFSETENLKMFRSRAVVPLVYDNDLLGVLVCAHKEPGGLVHSDIDRLLLIGSYAASALLCSTTKQQWEQEKNVDLVTGLHNHRFLSQKQSYLENQFFNQGQPVFMLMVQITNMPTIYGSYGLETGDHFLRQIVSLLSHVCPQPKQLYKFSDSTFLILLYKISEEEASHLEIRLKQVLDDNPFYVDGKSILAQGDIGLASHPEEADSLSQLIAQCFNKITPSLKAIT